jgi:REP element-mobilizing transposase RayT
MNDLQPHGCNLRKNRVSETGRIYLITCVTHLREPFLSQFIYGRLLVQVLMKEKPHAETLAYVVMPDHLHWLIQLQENVQLGSLMRTVKCVSSHQINQHSKRSGKFWQPGYHDHALRKEEDLVSVARYIVANPLRAGIVKRIGDYPLWDAIWL